MSNFFNIYNDTDQVRWQSLPVVMSTLGYIKITQIHKYTNRNSVHINPTRFPSIVKSKITFRTKAANMLYIL